MCDPITIASAALTAGSVGANTIATSRANSAREDVLRAERIRQAGLDDQAAAINKGTRQNYADFTGEQADRGAKLGDMLVQASSAPGNDANAVLPASTSSVVARETAARAGEAKDYVAQQGQALGQLRSFGDLFGEKSRLQGRDAALVDQIGGFQQRSAGIVPMELEQAAQAGSGYRLAADIMGGLGSIGTAYGLTRGIPLAAGAAGASNPMGATALVRAADRASVPAYAATQPTGLSSFFRF